MFNPLFGRRGIPNIVKAGLILTMSVCVFSMTSAQTEMPSTLLGLAITFLMELLLGYVLGLVVNFFFYIPVMAGSVVDMQMGLSMASTYDPASGIQVTATSNFLNVLMSLLFFAANGHHTMLRIFLNSGLVVPFGEVALREDFYSAMIQVFLDCTILGVTILNLDNGYNFIESIVCAAGAGIGFLVAMVLFSGVRRRVEQAVTPKCFEGLPITLVAAAVTSLSFMGFGGIVDAIFKV